MRALEAARADGAAAASAAASAVAQAEAKIEAAHAAELATLSAQHRTRA